jgi:hypothetical protein
MLDLSTVTLLCVDSRAPALATWALNRCLRHARFAKTVLMTNVDAVPERQAGIEYVQCPPMATTRDYSEVMLRGIAPHVEGSHVLIVQWDGFILHPECWDQAFFDYDYIGAVWPQFPETPVGNGGFSLRSRLLLEAMQSPGMVINHPEDRCICVTNRPLLEQEFGIRFAPAEVAERFAVERTPWHKAFGFHGLFNFARVLEPTELRAVIADLPESCCGGVDSYDLIDGLRAQGATEAAAALFAKCPFRRKVAKRFIRTWLWMKTNEFYRTFLA